MAHRVTRIVYLVSAAVLTVTAQTSNWNPGAAASYLDNREGWWQSWPRAQRDQQTACVSCHTVLPYAMARPILRARLNQQELAAPERTLLAFIEKRVGLWNDTEPYYKANSGPTKPAESRGTEAVLNALILAGYDAPAGHMREVTRAAFDHAWALQLDSGAWDWLNFHYAPWETDGSQYWGTTLMAMAVTIAPESYREAPQIQSGAQKMEHWLKAGFSQQHLFNRAFLVWASSRNASLVSAADRKAVCEELLSRQREDGGWSLASLAPWQRVDHTESEKRSDAYATAIALLALQSGGSPAGIEAGRTWLIRNQERAGGSWPAWSPNKERDPASEIGQFLRDAGTAYAVLALDSVRVE